MADQANGLRAGRDDLWRALDNLLSNALPEGVRSHALGPLEADRRNRAGLDVPDALAIEARLSAFAMLSVRPLLARVRNGCDGPLVLMKGPELAVRYPGEARGFIDVDLLVPEPLRTHEELRQAGFVETDDPTFVQPRHHLRPLRWPELPLQVEIHGRPKWPEGLRPPATEMIIDSALPSELGVDGVLAPEATQHALLIVAHAWAHEPLWRLRDLVDVRAVAPPGESAAIARLARDWNMTRLWRTTDRVTDAVLGRGRLPLLIRPWAGHLPTARERTVLENHLRDWFASYWILAPHAALATTAHALVEDVLPAPEETWSDKLSRVLTASRNRHAPRSQHDLELGEAATRGRSRRPRVDVTERRDHEG